MISIECHFDDYGGVDVQVNTDGPINNFEAAQQYLEEMMFEAFIGRKNDVHLRRDLEKFVKEVGPLLCVLAALEAI